MSHEYLEMDVYSRTAGLGERCRTATGGHANGARVSAVSD
jgi:hypothetical protein